MPRVKGPLKITFINGSNERLLARMRERRGAIIPMMTRALTLAMLRLQQHVVRDKLQGQVLQQRRGAAGLAGSVVAEPAHLESGKIIGRVYAGGGPFWYGRVHEDGGRGAYVIEPVNKKALANVGTGFGPVRRVVHPPLPKRPFMAPALRDMRAEIVNRVRRAALEALK